LALEAPLQALSAAGLFSLLSSAGATRNAPCAEALAHGSLLREPPLAFS
jgi:hypothetical protein